MTHILVADDHPMCATALGMAARAVDPTVTKDCATTLAEAESLVRQKNYDLVLLDLMLPDVQGFAGLALLRAVRPSATIAIVSGREEPTVIAQARALGAQGFIPKSSSIDQMMDAIRSLLSGKHWVPAGVEDMPHADPRIDLAERMGTLSIAQLRVLRAIANGHQNKQIAYDLQLAEPTVKSHLSAIFRKLGVTNRTQAVLALQAFDA
ncbi:LuxR family transcriptional regulator [Sphingomonas sp. Leaf67]|uniref:response regulator transcription factor n=1 Tax=unclassified Sphingomonas TaxID=196159 RepID=UPI0006FC3F02|nr:MULTISPECIES: response regulator transcription factor [unclassified Sphingomonas]KQN71619.1 LuxR family transcriptional regulator [Sphingomonas sp. Leaf62]KQN91808.1 LuxR family transcriptional regulator [Sphingomonas sp. Leaf67]